MNNNIKKQLKKMRVRSLSQQEKESVWRQVSFGITATNQSVIHKTFTSSIFRKSIAMTLIFGMTAGTAMAADGAKPGDLLFPLDRALENVHLSVVSGPKKDELKVKFALERVEEVKEIFNEISTKTRIKKAEEKLETPPPKKPGEDITEKENVTLPETEIEEDDEEQSLPVDPSAQTNEESDMDTLEDINVNVPESTNPANENEQASSSDDGLPTEETDTASTSEKENSENTETQTEESENANTPSKTGSTTGSVATDEEQGIKGQEDGKGKNNMEMSDVDKKRIELALGTALDFLSDVKGELAEQGNSEAVSSIDNLLKDLNDEISDLPENVTFEIKLSSSKQKIHFEITSEDNKDVVHMVETPATKNDNETEKLNEASTEPKETKLEIKDGTLMIKTEEDSLEKNIEETSVDKKLPEETDEDVGQPIDETPSADLPAQIGEDIEETDPNNDKDKKDRQTNDPSIETETGKVATGTISVESLDKNMGSTTDETTTVKVIIKKLDEDLEFSVTDQDEGLHDIIEEYTDEKGEV